MSGEVYYLLSTSECIIHAQRIHGSKSPISYRILCAASIPDISPTTTAGIAMTCWYTSPAAGISVGFRGKIQSRMHTPQNHHHKTNSKHTGDEESDNGLDERLLPIFVGPCEVDGPSSKNIPSSWWKDVMDTHKYLYDGGGSKRGNSPSHSKHGNGEHDPQRKAVLFSYKEGVYFTFTKQVNFQSYILRVCVCV